MIQLYDPQTTDFTLNGHVLTDISNDVVTWKMNTTFELSFDYPLFSPHGAQLAKEMIVTVPTPDKFEHDQGFRINSVIKSMGIVTVHAYHLFWDLNQNFIEDINIVGDTGAEAIEHIMTNTQYDHTFRYTSDLVNTANARQVRMSAIKALIGDDDNSFITRFGGQFEWDNFEFNVQSSIGQNRGVVFRNGKNLTGYTFEENIDSVVTRIMPEGYDGLLLPEKYVDADNIGNYLNPRIAVIEYSDIKAIDPDATTTDEDSVPLEEAYEKLRTAAKAEFSDNNLDKPTNTISLNVILLENTEEYKDKGQFTKVYPGDTARFVHTDDNVDTEAQLTGYTWQPSNQEYLTVTFDSVTKTSPTLSQTISRVTKSISSVSENVKAVAANGDNGNNWGENAPVDGVDSAKEGDLWFEQRGSTLVMWIYENGHWVEEASDLTGEEIKKKVDEQFEGLATWKANVQSDLDLIKANNATFNAQVEALNVNYASMQESVAKIDASVKADISTLGAQAQSAIDALAKLQADQSDMSTKLTTVTNRTDELNGKVTQAVTTTQLADAQTSWTNAQRLITEGMITDEVSKVTVGGRNLIKKSNFQKTFSGYGDDGMDSILTMAFKKGDVITLTVNGHVDQQALNDGKLFRAFVYPQGWPAGAAYITANINSLTDTTVQVTGTITADGQYNFNPYMTPSGGSRTGKVTLNWATVMVGNKAPLVFVPAPEDGLTDEELEKKGYVTETTVDNKITSSETGTKQIISKSISDIQVGGVNLLTGTGSHTVTGAMNHGYLSNETNDNLLTLFKGLEGQTLTVSVDYEYSGFVAGSGYNRLGWEIKIIADTTTYSGPWYYPKNDSGLGRISATFVLPKNIKSVDGMGHVELSGSRTGTLSHFKVEKGTLATDWSPAPEDNVSVEAFNKIESTVEGTTQTIKDMQGNISTASSKADSASTAVTNMQGEMTKTTQIATGAQTLAQNAASKAEVNTLADQWSVKLSSTSQPNQVANSDFKNNNTSGWSFSPATGHWHVGTNTYDTLEGTNTLLYTAKSNGDFSSNATAYYQGIPVPTDQSTMSFSGSIWGMNERLIMARWEVWALDSKGTRISNIKNLDAKMKDIGVQQVKAENLTLPKGTVSVQLVAVCTGSTKDGGATIYVRFSQPNVVWGPVVPPYKPAIVSQAQFQSQISATQDSISLSVQSAMDAAFNDVATADHMGAMINLSSDGIYIMGNKIHIDGNTVIEDASIKSAAIESLVADKIKAGTLDANMINVVNVNAASIVTGILRGANLSLNLNTGQVEFQKGRIHSVSNNIDINIDQGYMSVADASSRVLLKGGELQFTETNMFSLEDSPYMRISNNLHGLGGVGVYGRSNISLTINNGGAASSLAGNLMGAETFRGVSVQDGSITKVGGANSGVLIRGGSAISGLDPIVNTTPFIGVGVTGSNGWGGQEIHIVGQYTRIPSASNVTSSNSPNLVVGVDGTLMRSTSAAKYKTDIIRSASMDMANKLIGLPYATWADIAETKRHDEEPERWPKAERNFGMIAEDLAGAGLEDLVIRNNGELEGIQYDRIVPALLPLLKNMKDRIGKLEEQLNGQTATA